MQVKARKKAFQKPQYNNYNGVKKKIENRKRAQVSTKINNFLFLIILKMVSLLSLKFENNFFFNLN